MERVVGIEPTTKPWQGLVLPLAPYPLAHAARLLNLSAAYEAANAFGLTRGITLHIPFI